VGDISFKSTTRSPIITLDMDDYSIKSSHTIGSTYHDDVINYVYNLEQEAFDTIIIIAEKISNTPSLNTLVSLIKSHGTQVDVFFINETIAQISEPKQMGSYPTNDVIFLLKEIKDEVIEQNNQVREEAIQSGVHYSEMLPIEYRPTQEYLNLYHNGMKENAAKLSRSVAIVSEKIMAFNKGNVVLVSLARAGTPAGILIKRYLENKYLKVIPHYSISIIRGKGIDENALCYILNQHPNHTIQFLDGWTGKGAITIELTSAIERFISLYGYEKQLSKELAVIADPAHCVKLYGTREDYLIPNACLNSTVSGLLSRTVLRDDIVGEDDFHGVKYYHHLEEDDLSNNFINEIVTEFDFEKNRVTKESIDFDFSIPPWTGNEDVNNIMKDFDIDNIHFIKPGVGETTRVLLRRIPWKILIKEDAKDLEHIIQLAKEKGITIEYYPLKAYKCCGLVKSLKGE
jgi:hypothetical protein